VLTEWSSTGAGFEWISQLPNEHTPPLQESTWGDPHMVVDHQGASRGTTTGVTTEAMTAATIATMIATTTESTDHTDADRHLHTTAEVTALGPDHGPTLHVTTEQHEKSQQLQCRFFYFCSFFDQSIKHPASSQSIYFLQGLTILNRLYLYLNPSASVVTELSYL